MSGRRSHPRFVVASPWEGLVRVLRDVVVTRTGDQELLVLSQAPGVAGEEMTLDLMGGGLAMALRVKVAESRPVVVDGAVRHRLRLEMVASLHTMEDAVTSDDRDLAGSGLAEAL
jgi:hypothetical protein